MVIIRSRMGHIILLGILMIVGIVGVEVEMTEVPLGLISRVNLFLFCNF
jgi:hypothetical protein